MSTPSLSLGAYTGLAASYSKYRPAYSATVLSALLGCCAKSPSAMDIVDVGAGTGIWTRMLAGRGPASISAVEPNNDMREHGIADSAGLNIVWHAGSAESTGLPQACCDLVTMASSFHWTDFDRATAEFKRLLRPGGHFAALWNPRLLDHDPIQMEIEDYLRQLKPDMKRKSSGRSPHVEALMDRLGKHPGFTDLVYLQGAHMVELPVDTYMGAWRSVNDIQVQLGAAKFQDFLDFAASKLAERITVPVRYETRAWIVQSH